MIKIFRKIRYELMEKNKIWSYLKYAIGEIILVVIGILIALQLNIKNEERKERLEEEKLVKILIEDVISDSTFYSSRLLLFNKQIEFYNKFFDLCSREESSSEDTTILEQWEQGFILAANYSDVVNNNTELISHVSSDSIQQALREYFKSYHFISKAIDFSNEGIGELSKQLRKKYDIMEKDRDQLRLVDYRPFCQEEMLEGKVSVMREFSENSRDMTLRFLNDNEKLKVKLHNYLETF